MDGKDNFRGWRVPWKPSSEEVLERDVVGKDAMFRTLFRDWRWERALQSLQKHLLGQRPGERALQAEGIGRREALAGNKSSVFGNWGQFSVAPIIGSSGQRCQSLQTGWSLLQKQCEADSVRQSWWCFSFGKDTLPGLCEGREWTQGHTPTPPPNMEEHRSRQWRTAGS